MPEEHDPASASCTLTISLLPFDPVDAEPRAAAAARELGLLGVVMPSADAHGTIDLVVAAEAPSSVRVVTDGRLGTMPAGEVVTALRMRVAASVVCVGDEGVVAESEMPAALERAEEAFTAAEPPLLVAAIAPVIPAGVTAPELALTFRSDVVDVVIDGRQLVVGRAAGPVVWGPSTRPVVAVQHTAERTIAAIWSRHAVRTLQSPARREAAMVEPDVVLEWMRAPQRLAGDTADDAVRAIEDALVASIGPQLDADARAAVLPVLAELGIAHRLDELVGLATTSRSEATLDRLVTALDLPPIVADIARGSLEPVDIEGASRTEMRGLAATIGAVLRETVGDDLESARDELRAGLGEELGPDRAAIDRRRRRWLAVVLAPLLAVGNLVLALGLIPAGVGGEGADPRFLIPAAVFAGVGAWSGRALVRESRRAPRAASADEQPVDG